MCLFSWALLSAHAQQNQQRARATTNLPYGISVVNKIDAHRVGQLFDTGNPTLNAYSNPNTSGITFRTSWADVESEDGKFDFSKIDIVFANAEKKWQVGRAYFDTGFRHA